MSRSSRGAVIATLCVAALGVGVGCGGDDEEETAGAARKATYVGTVKGTNAYIALVSDGKQVSGYVCDGTPKAIDVYFWLDTVDITDGEAKLESRRGDPLGEATFEDGKVTGDVEVNDEPHSFTADTARSGAGLYRGILGKVGQSGTLEAGWIVLNNGTQRGGSGSTTKTLSQNVATIPNVDVLKREIPNARKTDGVQANIDVTTNQVETEFGELQVEQVRPQPSQTRAPGRTPPARTTPQRR
jgi:hypothetical protein